MTSSLDAIFKPFVEGTDFATLMHSHIRSAISAIDTAALLEPKYAKIANDYKRSLQLIIAKHEYALNHKLKKNPHLSAYNCVMLNDVETLKYWVWNEQEVNQVDKLGRTALHLAVARGHKECVEVLLHHPHVNLGLKARPGQRTAEEMATAKPAIKELFERN